MEPPPVLITPLQVKVCRCPQIGALFKHGRVGNTRIEPDVQDVHFLLELPATAFDTSGPRGQQILRIPLEPAIRALLFEESRHMFEHLGSGEEFAATIASEHCDGDPPRALPGDAPIRAVGDHVMDAFPSPVWDPLYTVDPRQGLIPQAVLVHGDEPLLRGPKNDRFLAPPAVRIAVGEFFLLNEVALLLEFVSNVPIGIEDKLAREKRYISHEATIVING